MFSSIKNIINLLSNSEHFGKNHGLDRIRKAIWTIGASSITKGITVLTPFITTPITMRYLGDERFGLWMTITSVLAMLAFADLGMGNGLLTEVSKFKGKDDAHGMKCAISTAYFILGCSTSLALTLFLIFLNYIPWGSIVNASTPALSQDAKTIGAICITCFIINVPLNLISKIQLGLQQGYISELWQIMSSLSSMILIVCAVYCRASIAVLILCVAATPLIFMLLNTVTFFRRNPGSIAISRKFVDFKMAGRILHIGVQFLILSILTSLSLYCDNLIVAHSMNLEDVAILSITEKPVKMLSLISVILCMPFWAVNGEALARRDTSWVKKNTIRLCLICFGVTALAAAMLLIIGPWFFRHWIGADFQFSSMLLLTLSIWSILFSISSPFFMVLNGAGLIWVQIKIWLIFLPIAVLCKVWFSSMIGLSGIPLGGIVPYILLVLPWTIYAYLNILKHPKYINLSPTVKADDYENN